jgi:hypothetical protein
VYHESWTKILTAISKIEPFWRRFGSKGNVALARPVRNRYFYNFSSFEIKSPCFMLVISNDNLFGMFTD